MPSPSVIGWPNASVSVAHHGLGSPSTVVQPVQVTPQKIKGKLHSEFGSAPDVVGQVGELLDVGGGGGRPEE